MRLPISVIYARTEDNTYLCKNIDGYYLSDKIENALNTVNDICFNHDTRIFNERFNYGSKVIFTKVRGNKWFDMKTGEETLEMNQ
jgi:hypothetical protein